MWKANSRKLIWLVSTLDHKLFYERPVVNILSFATGPGLGCHEMQQFLTKLYWSLRLKGEKGRHQYYRSCLHLKFWHFGQFVGGILSIKKKNMHQSIIHSFLHHLVFGALLNLVPKGCPSVASPSPGLVLWTSVLCDIPQFCQCIQKAAANVSVNEGSCSPVDF